MRQLLSLIVISSFLFGCSKENTKPFQPAEDGVYVAGYEKNGSNTVAKYWRNGTGVSLTGGQSNAGAQAIVVSASGDIYVAGYETNGSAGIAKYWKNNIAVNLTDGSKQASATDIFVLGNDVYVLGWENNINGLPLAKYWKNGIAVDLPLSGGESSHGSSIVVSGIDVHVVGWEKNNPGNFDDVFPRYWRNGVAIPLTTQPGFAFDIFLNGADIYISGAEVTYPVGTKPINWKNGMLSLLPSVDNFKYAYAHSIFVSGSDVHVCGPDGYTLTYWKNGVANTAFNSTGGSARSIYLDNDNVYIAGATVVGGYGRAVYWKNGGSVQLSTIESEATSIFVK